MMHVGGALEVLERAHRVRPRFTTRGAPLLKSDARGEYRVCVRARFGRMIGTSTAVACRLHGFAVAGGVEMVSFVFKNERRPSSLIFRDFFFLSHTKII